MQKCLRGGGGGGGGGRAGTFASGKKSPPFPRPPFPPPKTAHRANRIMEGVSGKKGLDDTTGRDGKNVALSPSGCLPQNRACRLGGVRRRRGAAPPTARPTQHRGPTWGTGVQGLRRPRSPAASPRLPRPDAGQWPSSDGYSTERKRISSPPASPKKRQRGRSSRRRPAPLQNRAQHGQPTLPSAAGVMTAKRRRTTGPRRRTWAWRTGCCPHGPGCRHGRAAGCWSPSHAPRA